VYEYNARRQWTISYLAMLFQLQELHGVERNRKVTMNRKDLEGGGHGLFQGTILSSIRTSLSWAESYDFVSCSLLKYIVVVHQNGRTCSPWNYDEYTLWLKSRHSSVNIVARLRAGRPEFDSRQGLGYYFLATESRPTLRPTQSPIKWVRGTI